MILAASSKKYNTGEVIAKPQRTVTTATSMIHGVEIFHLMACLKLRKKCREGKLALLTVIMGNVPVFRLPHKIHPPGKNSTSRVVRNGKQRSNFV